MAKVRKVWRKNNLSNPKCPPLTVHSSMVSKKVEKKKTGREAAEKKLWKSCNCSVCLEYPHNAVLLLCSSYNTGCRPYMCATSSRHSNCLEQYKKAYIKDLANHSSESCKVNSNCFGEEVVISELLCPLCRGQVKGWTVVEPARKYFNTKRRACMKDKCSFIGNYKKLKKHVRLKHPNARPREVDIKLAAQWNQLEWEREREDVISMIQSSIPGASWRGIM